MQNGAPTFLQIGKKGCKYPVLKDFLFSGPPLGQSDSQRCKSLTFQPAGREALSLLQNCLKTLFFFVFKKYSQLWYTSCSITEQRYFFSEGTG
jgi:hypothetical protein